VPYKEIGVPDIFVDVGDLKILTFLAMSADFVYF